MDDLVEWLRVQLDQDENVAQDASQGPWSVNHRLGGSVDAPGWSVAGGATRQDLEHIALHDPAHELNVVAAHRAILAEHLPQWQTVEWDHDQNGKGEALCCPRCQNAEHSEWNPPLGRARGLPEGFVTPYVLAPCHTLRLLALVYDQRPGYQEEWRP